MLDHIPKTYFWGASHFCRPMDKECFWGRVGDGGQGLVSGH